MATLEQLQRIMPNAGARAAQFLQPLNAAMAEFAITTLQREAAFLAQVAHESGSLRYVRELADGRAYENRRDLGNLFPGDGPRYKGRGLIQITGRTNYILCGKALGLPLIDQPELLEQPAPACRSAAWFWRTNGLNELADQQAFLQITRRINGGTNGLAERQAFYAKATAVLGC